MQIVSIDINVYNVLDFKADVVTGYCDNIKVPIP